MKTITVMVPTDEGWKECRMTQTPEKAWNTTWWCAATKEDAKVYQGVVYFSKTIPDAVINEFGNPMQIVSYGDVEGGNE